MNRVGKWPIWFAFFWLLLHGAGAQSQSHNENVPEVVQIVQKMTLRMPVEQRGDPIILTESNTKYHCMAVWWAENLQKLGINHFLIIALDPIEHKQLLDLNFTVLWPKVHMDYKAAHFRTREFNEICVFRWQLIRDLLMHGYDVILADVDVHWRKNPLPYIRKLDRCDMYISVGVKELPLDNSSPSTPKPPRLLPPFPQKKIPNWLNMGFAYFRSRPLVIKVANDILNDRIIKKDDQTIFNHYLNQMFVAHGAHSSVTHGLTGCAHYGNLTFHALRPDYFPHRLMAEVHPHFRQSYYTMHMNWVGRFSDKVAHMVSVGVMNASQCPIKSPNPT
eukprot:GGOE01001084.1.p1 GENE.GGOE01001084.1~~GGOE01001084.1.p1  ORF type:complete len:333 (-),score=45.63 GGOE01001084.1:226-1224(-)